MLCSWSVQHLSDTLRLRAGFVPVSVCLLQALLVPQEQTAGQDPQAHPVRYDYGTGLNAVLCYAMLCCAASWPSMGNGWHGPLLWQTAVGVIVLAAAWSVCSERMWWVLTRGRGC